MKKNDSQQFLFNVLFSMSVLAIFALVLWGCKNNNDTVTTQVIQNKLSGGDIAQWKIPFSLRNSTDSIPENGGDTLLTFNSNGNYYFQKGIGCPLDSGTWLAYYTPNASGNLINLIFKFHNGGMASIQLQYSADLDQFYFVDGKGVFLPLVKSTLLFKKRVDINVPSSFQHRQDMVWATYNGKIYTGFGSVGSTYYNDWYVFDGSTFKMLTPLSSVTELIGARAIAMNNKIYVVGGFLASSVFNTSTFVYDPSTDKWTVSVGVSKLAKYEGVYINVGGKEVFGLGNAGDTGGDALFYTRVDTASQWLPLQLAASSVGYTVPVSNALVVPWRGGFWVGGGSNGGDVYVNSAVYITNSLVTNSLVITDDKRHIGGNTNPPPFANGAAVESNNMSIVFGVQFTNSSSKFDYHIYTLGGGEWNSYPVETGPTPGVSSVVWKVTNNGVDQVFIGLGAVSDPYLYQLIFQ